MQLRRTGFYRLSRMLAGILPAVIVVLIAVPIWDYWNRAEIARAPLPPPEEFPQDLAVRGDVFQVTQSEGGKDIFTVSAEVTLGTKDNRQIAQGVEIEIYPQHEGDPIRHISADQCSYDQTTSDIDCNRNVTVRFDESTLGYTEQLTYNHAARTITSDVHTNLEQPGEMKGGAGHVVYSTQTGMLRLSNGVNIHLSSGATLRSGLAVFHQKENWATVSLNVELLSPNGNIRGASGRAELAPGTYRPRVITVDGGVTVESGPASSREKKQSWTIRSQWLRGDLSPESRIDHVLARGKAEARRNTDRGEETLTGGEIEGFMDADGHLQTVEARQAPQFMTSSGSIKASSRIVIDPDARVTTTGDSILDAGNGTIVEGRDFSLTQKNNVRVFETTFRSVLTSREFRTEGDRSTAEFDPQTNQLIRLVQSGKVEFQQGSRSGYAQNMTVSGNGNDVRLEGAARVVDGATQTVMNAQRILLDQKNKAIEGAGDVVVTDNRAGEAPIRVTSGRVTAREDTVEYHDRVQLYRGDANVATDHLTANSTSNGFHAEGNVWFRIGGGFDARSQSLDFSGSSDKGQSATFRGNVIANRRDENGRMELKTAIMHVRLKPGNDAMVETIEARGGVEIRQGNNRTGEGVEADYNAATGQVILRGSDTVDAVVRGPEGETRGFLIQTNPEGRWAAVQPSRISGSVKTSTEKPRK